MAKPVSDTIWRDFIQWCAKRRLRSLPAHPWTLAAYLRWRHEKDADVDLKSITETIRRTHKKAEKRSPHREPIVERTVALIKNKQAVRSEGSDLFDADSLLFADAKPPVEAIDDEDDEASDKTPQSAARRTLRSQPKLVSRRPKGDESAD